MKIEKDIVVVGAGTAGSQAALQLAREGFSVAVLESRSEGKAGARWCNAIVPWQFERAGVPYPEFPEMRATGGTIHMLSPSGRSRFEIADNPCGEADMRRLGERLQHDAQKAGVEFFWNVTDLSLRLDRGRPVEIEAAQGKNRLQFAGSLFVDAAGRQGVLRNRVPAFEKFCPPVGDDDLCSAQHFVFELADRDGARKFLETNGARPGDPLNWLGLSGGFSALMIRVETSLEEVSVLTGTVANGRYGSGPELMNRVRRDHPWIGRPVFGGGNLIPLRRVYDRLAAPGIALVGDAACQVMAAHGSGIGYGLIAGKVLAEAVSSSHDPGSAEAMWRYQSAYLREYGGTLAAYDVFRRMSVELDTAGVERMYETGIFGPSLSAPGLYQRLGGMAPADILEQARTLVRERDLARVIVPALARMGAAQVLYAGYPVLPWEKGLERWSKTVSTLLD